MAVTNADNSRWEHGYDFLGQVTNGVKKWSDNSTVAGQQFAYNFDDIGNRLWTTRDGRQTDYANNDLNQITGRTVPGYANVLGSATNASKVTVNYQATDRKADYFYKELGVTNSAGPVWLAVTNLAVLNNGTNADIIATNIGSLYIPPANESLTYDADGNLTSDGRWNNGWDAENRLISQETTEAAVAAGIPKEKLDNAYDWRWRRVQKTVSGWNGASWTNAYQRKFVYDGWNLQAELDGNGNLVHSFVWGNDASGTMQGAGGVGGLLAMIVHQGTNAGVYFYCHDGSHRVAALVDTNGVVVAQYEYGPFLELLRAIGLLARENPFLGTSKYYDWETGCYYYGYRFYGPGTGQWSSTDLMEEMGGANLYAFVANDTLNSFDILGLRRNIVDIIGPDQVIALDKELKGNDLTTYSTKHDIPVDWVVAKVKPNGLINPFSKSSAASCWKASQCKLNNGHPEVIQHCAA